MNRCSRLLMLIFLLDCLLINITACQNLPPFDDNKDNIASQIRQDALIMSLSILVFGLIICLAEICVILRKKDAQWDQSTTRVLGLTMILFFGTFLITAGYSETQIASMMGLLGTVAGYLLAKTD